MTPPPPIQLRPLTAEDFDDAYLAWFRDPEVTRFLEARHIGRADAVRHLEGGEQGRRYRLYAIVDSGTGTHIGNIKLGPIDWRHRVADCVTVIGDRRFWGGGRATEAIRQVIRIAFDELKLRKLSAGIVSGNENSLKAYTRAGFVVEGVLKGQWLMDGETRDRICIGCFNPADFPPDAE